MHNIRPSLSNQVNQDTKGGSPTNNSTIRTILLDQGNHNIQSYQACVHTRRKALLLLLIAAPSYQVHRDLSSSLEDAEIDL